MERTDRIEEEIKKVASKVISQDLKDPRLTGLISITRVNVTKDLKYCKIFVSGLNYFVQYSIVYRRKYSYLLRVLCFVRVKCC